MPSYKTSDGDRLQKSVIDSRVVKAKEAKIEAMMDEQGYISCEICGINAAAGEPIDCSHDVSVKECQESGRSELAYDITNITMRCRTCHRKHDKTL